MPSSQNCSTPKHGHPITRMEPRLFTRPSNPETKTLSGCSSTPGPMSLPKAKPETLLC
ncbi:hypothetical protein BDW74DRAFT_164189 [Aspergillus multicolor]|uniref:uncharacterized protein n=1 Tax=Aspergillus multicolor TaxID=41759 RepID=UPI003CCCF80E